VNPDDPIGLTFPLELPLIEPFATVLIMTVVPEAIRGSWFESGERPPKEDLERISRRIETQLAPQFGHPVHPAIWVHALFVCVHFFYRSATAIEDPEEAERQTSALDAAHALVYGLKHHHNLYELYLRMW